MLWKPCNILGRFTSPRSHGWKNALEALGGLSYKSWKLWLDKRFGSPTSAIGLVIGLGSLSWNKHSGALEGLGRDQFGDGLWCPTMKWNHCLMGWGGLASGSPSLVLMDCSMRSHIHAWNMARRWLAKERFGSTISTVKWSVELPNLVSLCIINNRLFLRVNSWVL